MVVSRKDLDDVKQRLDSLGATHVFSQTEVQNVDKKKLFVSTAFCEFQSSKEIMGLLSLS
jgi:hypothetical protein